MFVLGTQALIRTPVIATLFLFGVYTEKNKPLKKIKNPSEIKHELEIVQSNGS